MIKFIKKSKFFFSNDNIKPPSQSSSTSYLKSFLRGTEQTKNDIISSNPIKKSNKKQFYTPLPPFSHLQDEDIFEFTNYSFNLQLKSPFRWTPLIQKRLPTKEFFLKMKEFSKRRYFSDDQSYNELIDCMIFESLKGTDFDYYYDYKCLPSEKCKFYGTTPFLIYNKKHQFHLPIIPVIRSRRVFNTMGNVFIDEWNLCEAIGAGIWALDNMKAIDKGNEINCSRVLQTNGNIWRLYEFDTKGGFKKTGFYTPRNQYKKIYEDSEMQEIILGLINFAVGELDGNENELKAIYDYLDDRKYFQRVDEDTKELIRKKERFWRFLPKKIRLIFFNE